MDIPACTFKIQKEKRTLKAKHNTGRGHHRTRGILAEVRRRTDLCVVFCWTVGGLYGGQVDTRYKNET